MEVLRGLPYYYRELEGADTLSDTFKSNEILTPLRTPSRLTSSQSRYRELRKSLQVSRLPWGSEREYGGIAPVTLPADHRPKSEPPPLLSKGRQHYGFGGDSWPRGYPIEQYYDLTQRKKSKLYGNDSLLPKPPSTKAECALFPTFTSPGDQNTGILAAGHQPFPPTMPTKNYDTTVLKKTKGNPYRHEVIDFPTDSQKKPLQWPGQRTYFHLPKFVQGSNQLFYPKPPKALAPNTNSNIWDPSFLARVANIQRNLERATWMTTNKRNFTGLGPMNPLELDDYHEKEVAKLTGEKRFDSEPKEKSHPTFSRPRPLEGRIARLLQGRRPHGSESRDKPPSRPERTPAPLGVVQATTPGPGPMETSTPSGVERGGQISKADKEIKEVPPPRAFSRLPPLHDQVVFYEVNPFPKITDTCQTESLYWRQLAVSPEPIFCEDLKPRPHSQYPVGQKAVRLSKPGFPGDRRDQGVAHLEPVSSPLPAPPNAGDLEDERDAGPPRINAEGARPQTSLMERQDSFSKTDTRRRFHESIQESKIDLRDNHRFGRRYRFYGFHSFYFHN
ncbi:uncharacterized protein C7orf31 homolog isoform X2 [Ornithorhynchus anatinus]|uniref:uncharacterized protein C7orf31 homolog isoform X2 n=1 Tax=Ornithorhynchus anatinus TaxID=9258 RepID=UPI0010A7B571|nr:uncharacterized protein C7orf31 homolog isoform X2 [Ornithorhynchus anatinus]